MLFRELDKVRRNVIMTAIVLMFVGIAFLVVPEAYIRFLGSGCAFLLLVSSTVTVLEFVTGPKVLIRYLTLVVAMLAAVLGVALFVFDGLFLDLLTVLVGVIPIVGGFLGSYHALVFARRAGRRGWWVPLVFSLFLFVFGTMAIVNPWADSARGVLMVIGGVLTYSALVYALLLVWIWPPKTEEA